MWSILVPEVLCLHICKKIKKVVCEYISMFWALINLTQMGVP